MLLEHEGRAPVVDPGALVAPTAAQATRRYAALFGRHRDDTVVG